MGKVGTDHDDWRHETKNLLDDGAGVDHLINELEGQRGLDIVTTDCVLLLTDLGQDLGVISRELEGIDDGRSHCVLGGKQERENDHSNLVVRVFTGKHTTFLSILDVTLAGSQHGGDPFVQKALCFGARLGHALLGRSGCGTEVLHGDLASLDGVVNLCSWDGERKVDELESDGDEPVLFRDFLSGRVGDVVAAKDAERSLHVEVAHGHHERLGTGNRVGLPLEEMTAVNTLLDREVDSETREDQWLSAMKLVD